MSKCLPIINLCLTVVSIIMLIIVVIKLLSTKEAFGKLERVKLLASAANKADQAEKYVASRVNMMFPGQFDWLKNGEKEEENKVKQITTVAEDLAKNAAEKLEEIANTPITQEEPKQKIETGEVVDDSRDVISNSGNSLEIPANESFVHSRIYNQFDNILGGTVASQVAQSENQEQTSYDMKTMEKKMM